MTVLFSGVIGSTSLSEKKQPEEVVSLLTVKVKGKENEIRIFGVRGRSHTG